MDNKNNEISRLSLRIKTSLKNKLEENRKILNLSQRDYIEEIIDNGVIEIIEINNDTLVEKFDILIRELDYQGKNINQIAKKLNLDYNLNNKGVDKINETLEFYKKLYNLIDKKTQGRTIYKSGE